MPLNAYYKGKGRKVYADMVRRYGRAKGEDVFYAVANERGLKPKKRRRVRKKHS